MAMASDTHLIGLNAPLKNDCLALEILVPFLDFPICTVIIESALEKKWPCPKNYKIGPFTLAKTKNPKNLGFLLYHLHCQEKPITFRVFGHEKRMREKTRISYLCFGKWCACATSLYL